MLTLFAMPKPFEGHIGVIQRNAIRSWTLLDPRPHIILIGSELGTAEIVRELGLTQMPEVARNAYGTPLLPEIFARAEAHSHSELLCYVNADIILTSDFMRAVTAIQGVEKRFLMGGRRWDVGITSPLDFEGAWETRLRERVGQEGRLDPPGSIDYFVYPRGLWTEIPPFAIGRFYWDSWLLYRARKVDAALIDATACVMVVHQRHGYNQSSAQSQDPRQGPEAKHNILLAGGEHHLYTLRSATHLLTSEGLERSKPGRRQLEFLQSNWRYFSRRGYRALQSAAENRPLIRPFLRPLLSAVRATRPLLSKAGRALVRYRDRNQETGTPAPDSAGNTPAV